MTTEGPPGSSRSGNWSHRSAGQRTDGLPNASGPDPTGRWTAPGVRPTDAPVSADPLKAIDWGTKLTTRSVDVYFAQWKSSVDGVSSQGWLPYEKQQVLLALRQIETIATVRFREIRTEAGAEFRLATTLFEDDTVAYMHPPGGRNAGLGVFDVRSLEQRDEDSGNRLLTRGGWMFSVVLHELGHGLGLAHPHDDGGRSTILKGVTDSWGSFGVGDLNQGVYTAMGYNHGWPGGPEGGRYQTGSGDNLKIQVSDFGYEATMMALDIAVLQAKYGANWEFAVGDNIYRLPDANRVGSFFRCIWDAGGSDTLRYDGIRAATLDLRPATLQGAAGGGGYISHADKIGGGFTIARGALIEHAVGGLGNDLCTGNAASNSLTGRGGDDILLGKRGDDWLLGGAGNDVLDGGQGADRMEGGAGDDRYRLTDTKDRVVEAAGSGLDQVVARVSHSLARNVEDLTLAGSAVEGIGNGFGNRIIGNSRDNVLQGRAGDDTLRGGEGHDHLRGGGGADLFVFRSAKDSTADGRRDVIEDFDTVSDVICLRGIDANSTADGNQSFVFIADAEFSGTSGRAHQPSRPGRGRSGRRSHCGHGDCGRAGNAADRAELPALIPMREAVLPRPARGATFPGQEERNHEPGIREGGRRGSSGGAGRDPGELGAEPRHRARPAPDRGPDCRGRGGARRRSRRRRRPHG